jgi:hypothetical protein
MTRSMLARKARITRVRSAQHLLAASAAASADQQVLTLETNKAKLGMLRDSLTLDIGTTTGAAMQNRGDLAQRLDKAHDSLGNAIVNARRLAEDRAAERLEARQKQESAAKLDARAAQAYADWIDARANAAFRPRGPRHDNSEQG